ncbi:Smr/MutS family protein [Jannaschia seohaensis]|uniref:DNA-nicking Smr family endonuclease n=1 Tax=Jannaschia seohaensis TaxID=475081 RepID=A0A2Y9A0U9_9RHOB|nr:Smr/MutS family protein [Jannaschia seohaensis]PWJ21746.1 DNA-nicking Smr family endonuclease [Jannaschia seohaensis]SSA38024.1 DNA-nicking endonuclease, Smr domain [Jannaschia seohaensis]
MRRRRLSAEDRELWQRYTRSTDPLDAARRDAPPPEAEPPRKPRPVPAPRAIQPFTLGARAKARGSAHSLAPTISEQVAAAPLRMDAKTHKRMKSGKLRPEAKLDLHGMTLAQAQPALARFVMSAQSEGKRLVLVVTGKGKSKPSDTVMPNRLGVLKHQVPTWLAMPPLASVVLQVTEASRSHGGSGAYYVYLRRG